MNPLKPRLVLQKALMELAYHDYSPVFLKFRVKDSF